MKGCRAWFCFQGLQCGQCFIFVFIFSIVTSNVVENQESGFDPGLKMWLWHFQFLTWACGSHALSADYLCAGSLVLLSLNLSRVRGLRDCQTDYSSNSSMCAFITCTLHGDLKFIRLLACVGFIRRWQRVFK